MVVPFHIAFLVGSLVLCRMGSSCKKQVLIAVGMFSHRVWSFQSNKVQIDLVKELPL